VATLAKWISKSAKFNGEVAFTTGMIHSIGEMLIHIVAPELAAKIDQYVENGAADRVALETNNIGFDYVMVGEKLAKRWNFPVDIQMAVKYQNMPNAQDPPSKLSHVLHIAHKEADISTNEEWMASLPTTSFAYLGIDQAAFSLQLEEINDLGSGMEEMIT
jgi:HD-like signal output (HDOD) protein